MRVNSDLYYLHIDPFIGLTIMLVRFRQLKNENSVKPRFKKPLSNYDWNCSICE